VISPVLDDHLGFLQGVEDLTVQQFIAHPSIERLAVIERYRRRDISIEEAIVQMYLAGVSVRRVEDITEALWGTRVSSGTVSKLNQKVYKHIERWRNQELEGDYAYVYLDGILLKRSWGGEIRNVSLLAAIGVDQDGFRRLLGVVEGHKEDKPGCYACRRPSGVRASTWTWNC